MTFWEYPPVFCNSDGSKSVLAGDIDGRLQSWDVPAGAFGD